MARKITTNQESLFHTPVPKMPDGYYSSGPNPNLRWFVEEHAKPYNPETDDYDVPPFDQPITTTKATAIYNMHTYWSKKPHDAIQQYVRHYTQPGDIVLDPFCGSGGTALAALIEGRTAIAIDLSPAATFITKSYCTPIDVDELQRAYNELQSKVKSEMDWLYETRCDRCDGRATIAYIVYSHLFQCPRCLAKVPLFDCVETKGTTADGRPKPIAVCPYCYAQGHVEEISTSDQRLQEIPVLVSYECQDGCRPSRGERRHKDREVRKRTFFQTHDLAKLKEIEAKTIPYWYPQNRMLNATSKQPAWGMLWRPYHQDIQRVDQFFTHANLWALSAILANIEPLACQREVKDTLRFVLQSCILNCSIMYRYRVSGKGGIAMGTYYVPPVYQVMNASASFQDKYRDVLKGIGELTQLGPTSLLISTQSALDLSDIRSDSIDLIFTDPPYSWKVQYGESNHIWEAWMKFDSQWLDDEVIINPVRGIDEATWKQRMLAGLKECYRVLKPGRWLSLCYHDTSEGTWEFVQDIASEVGFLSEDLEHTLYIDATQKSWKQLVAEKVTKRDLVINFRKPGPRDPFTQLSLIGDEDPATFSEKARAILRDALEAHPGTSADRLYDDLVSHMVHRGEFERHNFEGLLAQVAEPVREPVMRNLIDAESPNLFGTHEVARWYLRETAGQLDEAESRKEDAAAQKLETFMRRHLEQHPYETGLHYSDLFEQYLPVQDKPRRLLADWLPEFFYKTNEGTWRPPENEEERAQKASLRSSGTLRRIKRFANALLEGVPPIDRDRTGNSATAADWIRQCRRAGLYELGRVLFEKGGFDFGGLGEEAKLEVEEDYQVCVRRSGGGKG